MKFIYFSLLLSVTCINAQAGISGNPIKRQDNYTVNGSKPATVDVECIFTHSGHQPVQLNIWTSPEQTKPTASIKLSSKTKKTKSSFKLPLEKKWWCLIYVPYPHNHWRYCHYFSISDAVISEYHGFRTWNKTIHSTKTHYSCHLKQSNSNAQFFYFK